ncbi:hypothetical protein AB6A40_004063 [Gnathostoma spinigerum]|uniref:Uncharacterized protein n=1 Tax=Gnathostoma spinigerum TaxID=75299 RepID=A0ABD6EBC4_9BILA
MEIFIFALQSLFCRIFMFIVVVPGRHGWGVGVACGSDARSVYVGQFGTVGPWTFDTRLKELQVRHVKMVIFEPT